MSKLHNNYNFDALTPTQVKAIQQEYPTLDIPKLRRAYTLQRWVAVCARGIDWEFTFENWLKLWIDSGKIEKRGKRKFDYVLSRYNDQGVYSPENCFIQTNWENTLEGKNLKYLKD